MADDLIIIHDDQIDVADIMRQIRANIARREGQATGESEVDPVAASQELWESTVGDAAHFQQQIGNVPLTRQDCDIVPRHYVIDWRVPILGPIHAVVRRVINDEIRRYLFPSLEKQALFNRKLLRALKGLAEENARLRQEIEELRGAQESEIG